MQQENHNNVKNTVSWQVIHPIQGKKKFVKSSQQSPLCIIYTLTQIPLIHPDHFLNEGRKKKANINSSQPPIQALYNMT